MDANTFLAHAIRLEAEAARRFDELAAHMAQHGNTEVEAVFRQFADWSRLHLDEASTRGAGISDLPENEYRWPDGEPPETASWWGVTPAMTTADALALAFESEKHGLAFYEHIAKTCHDPEVTALAAEFVEEEQAHVTYLKKIMERTHTQI